MTKTSEKTSLGVPNLWGSRFALPKAWVLGMLIFEYYYGILMPSHDLSQNLGDDRCPSLVYMALPHITK